jgi:hypothetical protein
MEQHERGEGPLSALATLSLQRCVRDLRLWLWLSGAATITEEMGRALSVGCDAARPIEGSKLVGAPGND